MRLGRDLLKRLAISVIPTPRLRPARPLAQLEDLVTELCRNPTRILLAFTAPLDANRNWPLGGGRAGTLARVPRHGVRLKRAVSDHPARVSSAAR
jgi:hypothetical protein